MYFLRNLTREMNIEIPHLRFSCHSRIIHVEFVKVSNFGVLIRVSNVVCVSEFIRENPF